MPTKLVVLACCLVATACGSIDDEPVGTTDQALDQDGHIIGAVLAFDDVRFKRGNSEHSELYWYMDTRDAVLWANDPDCPNNDCGDPRSGPIPSGERMWDGFAPFAAAMCWASRNADHFVFNSVGGATTLAGSPPSADELAVPVPRNAAMRAWLPASAGIAKDHLRDRAVEMTGWVGRTNREVARSALRAGFNACHYAMDATACGHSTGNIWCDPIAATPSRNCTRFVDTNISDAGPLNVFDHPYDHAVVMATINVLAAYCNFTVPVPSSAGVRYATAERYIRHHTPLPVIEGGTDPDGMTWGAPGQTSTNGCYAGCENGECGGSRPPSEPDPALSCANVIDDIRDGLDANPLFFMSPLYEKDPVRQCRAVANARTCQWANGTCKASTWNGSMECVREVDYHEGTHGSLVIGTCDDQRDGVPQSFGGTLPPVCINDASNTVPPVAPVCVERCRAVKGYITSTGKCVTTTTTDFARTVSDVTPFVCGELSQNEPNGASCEPFTQPELCAGAGGFCTNDGNNACVRSFTNKILYPGQQYPTMVWNIANYIGSCGTGNPFNAPAFLPSCTSPGDVSWPDGPRCRPSGSECTSPSSCCGGFCNDPLTNQPFVGSSDGSQGVCRSYPPGSSPGYPGDYAWIDVASLGAGAGTVSFSSGGSCGDSCFETVPRSTTVVLTATPTGGASFSSWQGCDSKSGATCLVASNNVRTVKAFFSLPCDSGFADVPSTHPFCPYIRAMKDHGIVVPGEGCPAGSFCPDAVVGRPQMAAFVVRARFGESFDFTPYAHFTDVPWYDGFFKYVQKLRDAGITMGCTSTSFYQACPSPEVTRGQSAVFLMRAKFNEAAWGAATFFPTQTPYFQDVPAADGFFRFIQKVADLAITSGCSSSPQKFCPGDPVTRGQMAVFVTRTFWPDQVPAGSPPVPGNF